MLQQFISLHYLLQDTVEIAAKCVHNIGNSKPTLLPDGTCLLPSNKRIPEEQA